MRSMSHLKNTTKFSVYWHLTLLLSLLEQPIAINNKSQIYKTAYKNCQSNQILRESPNRAILATTPFLGQFQLIPLIFFTFFRFFTFFALLTWKSLIGTTLCQKSQGQHNPHVAIDIVTWTKYNCMFKFLCA